MNKSAEKHLAAARDYVSRGDEFGRKREEFYRKAAEEIIAAQKADPTLSNREAGEFVGYSADWVRDIVNRRTNDEPLASPWAHQTVAKQERAAKKMLRCGRVFKVRGNRRVAHSAPGERVPTEASTSVSESLVSQASAATDELASSDVHSRAVLADVLPFPRLLEQTDEART
jgi:hypothetical protein